MPKIRKADRLNTGRDDRTEELSEFGMQGGNVCMCCCLDFRGPFQDPRKWSALPQTGSGSFVPGMSFELMILPS